MKSRRLILSLFFGAFGICYAQAGCAAHSYAKYDSVADCYKCYTRPYFAVGNEYPIWGDVTKTVVEYKSMDRTLKDGFNFIVLDTITNLGTYDQSKDSLTIDCSTWESGTYMLGFKMSITTDTTPPFDCFPFDDYGTIVIVEHQKKKSTKLENPYTQPQLFELSSTLVQNSIEVELTDGITLAHGYIYNVLGQIQSSFDAQSLHQNISVSHLPAGFYILTIQTNKGQHSAWFKVQR